MFLKDCSIKLLRFFFNRNRFVASIMLKILDFLTSEVIKFLKKVLSKLLSPFASAASAAAAAVAAVAVDTASPAREYYAARVLETFTKIIKSRKVFTITIFCRKVSFK